MLTAKPFILALIAACGVTAGAASNPATTEPPPEQPDVKPPENVQKDQHFCCQSVDLKSMSGDGCTAISDSLELINACGYLLYCEGNYGKENGHVQCE
jgi:hypothetical protein